MILDVNTSPLWFCQRVLNSSILSSCPLYIILLKPVFRSSKRNKVLNYHKMKTMQNRRLQANPIDWYQIWPTIFLTREFTEDKAHRYGRFRNVIAKKIHFKLSWISVQVVESKFSNTLLHCKKRLSHKTESSNKLRCQTGAHHYMDQIFNFWKLVSWYYEERPFPKTGTDTLSKDIQHTFWIT